MLLINMETGYLPLLPVTDAPYRGVTKVDGAASYSRRQTMRVPAYGTKKRDQTGFQNILAAEEAVYLTGA